MNLDTPDFFSISVLDAKLLYPILILGIKLFNIGLLSAWSFLFIKAIHIFIL